MENPIPERRKARRVLGCHVSGCHGFFGPDKRYFPHFLVKWGLEAIVHEGSRGSGKMLAKLGGFVGLKRGALSGLGPWHSCKWRKGSGWLEVDQELDMGPLHFSLIFHRKTAPHHPPEPDPQAPPRKTPIGARTPLRKLPPVKTTL